MVSDPSFQNNRGLAQDHSGKRTLLVYAAKPTHIEGAATASRAVVWLIFLTCSLTLDFASTIEGLAPAAAVDLERVNATGLLLLGALWMRIFAAESDMVVHFVEAATRAW